MHQHAQCANMISMEILHLKIIYFSRFFCQFNIKLFNKKYVAAWIKEFISNGKFTSINKTTLIYIERVSFGCDDFFTINSQMKESCYLSYICFKNSLFAGFRYQIHIQQPSDNTQ